MSDTKRYNAEGNRHTWCRIYSFIVGSTSEPLRCVARFSIQIDSITAEYGDRTMHG